MILYDQNLSQYIENLFANEDEALRNIRVQTPEKGLPDIGIESEEGRFLQFLAQVCQAKLALEIGTLGGYSGTWIARGLPPGGKLITVELSERHAEVAREHFIYSGVSDKVEIYTGNAHQVLPRISSLAPFDFVFIDAEKSGYPDYYEWALEHLRAGGVIAAHNAFWGGSVAQDIDGQAINDIRDFNAQVAKDSRVICTIYPAGDGTLIAVKR